MLASDPALREALFRALSACLGLTRNTAAASSLIRPAYTEPENPLRPPRDRNVIYMDLQQEDVPAERCLAILPAADPDSTASRGVTLRTVQAFRLVLVCYGPDAEDHAHRIRTRLFLDGPGQPRAILRAAGIFPVPHPPQPVLLHEPENSLWRTRADCTVSLRVTDEQTVSLPAVTAAPAVSIRI